MASMALVVFAVAVAVALSAGGGCWRAAEAAENTMEEKCGTDFQKLTVCLSYATGKAATPTKDCCDSVKGIKESEPECLCFIMQQTHRGNEKIKSLGIQEAKLLQLPTACALKNATLTDCPKLLGLAPNSTEAAIFTNNSALAPSTTPAGTGTGTSQLQSNTNANGGTKLTGSHLAGPLAIALAAIVLFAFPAGCPNE